MAQKKSKGKKNSRRSSNSNRYKFDFNANKRATLGAIRAAH